MTTIRTYKCNVCKNEVDSLTGIGFDFKSAGTEFQEGNVPQHEKHLCYECISAIYDVSCRFRQAEK